MPLRGVPGTPRETPGGAKSSLVWGIDNIFIKMTNSIARERFKKLSCYTVGHFYKNCTFYPRLLGKVKTEMIKKRCGVILSFIFKKLEACFSPRSRISKTYAFVFGFFFLTFWGMCPGVVLDHRHGHLTSCSGVEVHSRDLAVTESASHQPLPRFQWHGSRK